MISAQDLRGYLPTANDGIIATAGVIEGFIAAGAGTDALLAAALAATVAGAVSFGGFKYGDALTAQLESAHDKGTCLLS